MPVKGGFHWRCNRKSASDLVNIKSQSLKWSDKLNGIRVGRIGTVPLSSDSTYVSDSYDPVKNRLSESQAEAEEPTNHNAWFMASDYDSDNLVFLGVMSRIKRK